jgi:DTW domain-containing protein YfiP
VSRRNNASRRTLTKRTRLLLVIHRVEARKPTNTGQLAAHGLVNSEVLVRGHEDRPTPPFVADPASQPVFLFPFDDAVPLEEFAGSERPVTLIVPDGTWRQASKVRARVPRFRDVPCAALPLEAPSTYGLRSEAHPHRLATIEAIARAMGILEGPPVRAALEHVVRAMVDRTLWSRGELEDEDGSRALARGELGARRSLGGQRDAVTGLCDIGRQRRSVDAMGLALGGGRHGCGQRGGGLCRRCARGAV